MTPKKKFYLTLSGWLAIFLLISALLILPLWGKIKEEADSLREGQEKLGRLQAELGNLQAFKETFQGDDALEALKNFFVEAKVPIAFITFLEEASRESQVSLEIIPQPTVKKEKTALGPSLSFLLKGQGNFSDFIGFLLKLEGGPYLIETETLSVSKIEEERTGNQQVAFSLLLKVYTTEDD